MSEGQQQQQGGTRGEVPLFAMAAHELKSPLALIRQLSSSIDDSTDLAQRREIIRRIELTSERALRLTASLTQSQNLEPSLFPLEPLNTLALCEDVARELTPLYTAKGCQIRVRSRRVTPLAVGNRELAHRVLTQFADNALQYARGAAVELSVVQQKQGTVRIGIRDYGPAVSEMVKPTKHNRAVTPRRPGSSGLGLLICQQFAEAMDGTIGVTRHRDGASFFIDLQGSTQLSFV